MIRQNIKIIFRGLVKNRINSISILIGFSLSFTVTCFILSFLIHELKADRFHARSKDIYRVVMDDPVTFEKGILTFPGLQEKLRTDYPEVQAASQVYYPGRIYLSTGNGDLKKEFREDELLYVDQYFLEIFNYKLLAGNFKDCLSSPNQIVLSKSAAERFFGSNEVLGQTIRLKGDLCVITGILENVPSNSHLKFDMLVSKSSIPKPGFPLDYPGLTYVLLKDGQTAGMFVDKLNRNRADLFPIKTDKSLQRPFTVQKLTDIYFNQLSSGFLSPILRTRDLDSLRMFGGVAIAILFLSIFNHLNFSQSKALFQIKEIIVKRAFGSSAFSIKFKFILESLILVSIALLISFTLMILLLPLFNDLTSSAIQDTFLHDSTIFLSIIGLMTIAGIVMGVLTHAIVAGLRSNNSFGEIRIKKGRVKALNSIIVLQLIVSIMLISITSIMINQIKFIRNHPAGYSLENVVEIQLNGLPENFNPQSLKLECMKVPQVISATVCFGSPLTGKWTRGIKLGESRIELSSFTGDIDFIRTLDLKVLKGREFDSSILSDTSAILVNETAAKAFELNDEFEPKDKNIKLSSGAVIGVVRDFHYSSLREKIGPGLIGYYPFKTVGFGGGTLVLRMTDENNDIIRSIENIWRKILPDTPFEYLLLDQKYISLYKQEFNQTNFLMVGTITSLIINFFGLVGLALFTAKKRSKEIAIRKVFGATPTNVLIMFLSQMLKAVLISSIIAIPVAVYFSDVWLQHFVYKAEPSFGVFSLSISSVILFALLSVFYQAYQASNRNPSEVIRYE